jgi:hypothetical protein
VQLSCALWTGYAQWTFSPAWSFSICSHWTRLARPDSTTALQNPGWHRVYFKKLYTIFARNVLPVSKRVGMVALAEGRAGVGVRGDVGEGVMEGVWVALAVRGHCGREGRGSTCVCACTLTMIIAVLPLFNIHITYCSWWCHMYMSLTGQCKNN